MRKLNSTMVAISWTVTIIFGIVFIISWINAANVQTSYGSPASSFPYILGMLIGNSIIPGILWIITYLTSTKNNNVSNLKPNNGGYRGSQNVNSSISNNKSGYSGQYSGGHNATGSSQNYTTNGNSKNDDGYQNGSLYN